MKKKINEQAKDYAIDRHWVANHLYNAQPYTVHLEQTVAEFNRYKHLIPDKYHETVEAACWAHDVIEDVRETFSDVYRVLGHSVADIVYAVTSEKGKTRSQRNERTYPGIREVEFAVFVKLCDRLANVRYSVENGCKDKLDMYRSENAEFCTVLFDVRYIEMFNELTGLLKKDLDNKN